MDPAELECFFVDRWNKTVLQCEKELESDDLERVRQITSWDALQCDALSDTLPYEISIIEPSLGHLRRFATLFGTELAIDLNAGFFWGTLNLLLKIIAQDSVALGKIPRMIKSLGYKAEAFSVHWKVLSDNRDHMKEACFDIQVQMVRFFVACIQSMRGEATSAAHLVGGESSPWDLLQRAFTCTNQELAETLAQAESLAAVHPRTDQATSSDTAAFRPRFRCLMVPTKKVSRFYDRVDTFDKIDQVIGGPGSSPSFRSVALHGLGGIGKSTIAARYIERKFEENEYDAIFWVHSERTASLRQSFTDIALRLKLDGAKPNLHDDNLIIVQNWLQLTECRWLIVYDNAESADALMPFWPEASHGRAIITTRNHALAYEPASSGIQILSWDEREGSEFLLFLLKGNIGRDIEAEGLSACEISKRLSGHALAISNTAGLIQRRSWSISEYMRIYLNNPKRAHQTELQALWDFSFSTLDKNSRRFLGIASFLASDNIPQVLFEFKHDGDYPKGLEFCTNEFSFSEATEPLLTLALMTRDRDSRMFSCHRMVQMHFQYYLSPEERRCAFYHATELIHRAFPKQSDQNTNQLYQHWNECNQLLEHVLSLKDHLKESPELCDASSVSTFCELLRDCQRYLYEANALDDLEDVCKVNLWAAKNITNEEQATDLIAWTLSLQASMYESIGKVETAIELNLRGYEMRLAEKPLKDGLLGGFEQNLAYNYNTANQHEKALEWFTKSKDRIITWNLEQGREADWPTVTKKNMARCLVYLGQHDEAEKLLNDSMTGFKQEKGLNWAMLAYLTQAGAYFVQGTLERKTNRLEAAEASFIEAQNLWIRGDQTRLHPFHAGCIYKIGVTCLDQGKIEAAVKHLGEALTMTKFHANTMPAEHARCLFKLSEALLQDSYNDGDKAKDLRDDAEMYLLRRDAQATEFGREDSYDLLVPIFWR